MCSIVEMGFILPEHGTNRLIKHLDKLTSKIERCGFHEEKMGACIAYAQENQFLKLWMGAGILPPRFTKDSHEYVFTGMISASPSNPPNTA